ncbi:MAG: hypothetical protein K8H88_24080, partial [Sandaracinaceae bacterium]|nr:hypothetical protein [Sandaracinaceae bacterium]
MRAASGLAWLGRSMIIAQDDAAFLGVREPSGRVHAISLARGPGGRRRFEARLGNKKDKPDLEG